MVYILFIVGFILLVKGAEWLVDGSASLARRYKISEMTIGLTIVSIGTSAPELIVNIIASINGNSDIAIGNIFGSNIANVLLILGITAVIYPIPIRKNTIRTDIPFVLVATLLVGFLANAHIFKATQSLFISRSDGIILLVFFGVFMSYVFQMSKNNPPKFDPINEKTVGISILLIIIGVSCLFFGGKWVVEGAVQIARLLNLSESFIGLTIVAIGTSLPELVTSIIAARKHNVDIAVGNVIGSNVFNLLWVIGISALIRPLEFDWSNNFDILIMLFSSTIIVFVIYFDKKKYHISRWVGGAFVFMYLIYIVSLIMRDYGFFSFNVPL